MALAKWILPVLMILSPAAGARPLVYNSEQLIFDIESLSLYNGKAISEIRVHGQKRTRESAIRGVLTLRAGDIFDAALWMKGIRKLYDTTAIFNIVTSISQNEAQIVIDLEVEDRWTLLPYGIAQAGGGSANLGAGLSEANFLGNFTQVSASYSQFNGLSAYDFNIYQEFFRDTDWMFSFDFAGTGTGVELQRDDRTAVGSFKWFRRQESFMLGHRFEPGIRFFTSFRYFRDQMISNAKAPFISVYDIPQYQIRPVLIVGRSDLTNFLKDGSEWVVAPSTTNFFDRKHNYAQLTATHRGVLVRDNTNYAYNFKAGAMTSAPAPYNFRLGGYDSVRGFSTYRAVGPDYFFYNLEYRPYLTRFPIPFFGQVVMQGNVFQDAGIMWFNSAETFTQDKHPHIQLYSGGLGVRFHFVEFAGAIVAIDVARTISPDEGVGLALNVGQFF